MPTVTLDQILLPLVQGGERVAFVNIDVEGHEFAVLKGGEALIARERPVLLVELEYRHGARVGEVFDWLKARRYVPRALADGKSLTPIDPTALRSLAGRHAALRGGLPGTATRATSTTSSFSPKPRRRFPA